MLETIRPQIEQIHGTPHKTVLAVSGAGTQAVAWLLGVSGASRTILEVVVPYGRLSMQAFLGFEPEQSASADTAMAMAKQAYRRAREQREDDSPAVLGLACAAAIATDRYRRGDHRAFVAAHDANITAIWSLTFDKGLRDRAGEEDVVSRLILRALSEFSGLEPEIELGLTASDTLEVERTARPAPLEQLLAGEAAWVVCRPEGMEAEGEVPPVLLPGSFNPLHIGHREMIAVATRSTGLSGAFELSVTNVDKPPLETEEIERRLSQFEPSDTVVLTRAETFQKKAKLFPQRTFLLGWDTAVRLVAPRYYGGDAAMMLALAEMMAGGARFLVAGRADGDAFRTLSDVAVPAGFALMFTGLTEDEFRRDISSTELRGT